MSLEKWQGRSAMVVDDSRTQQYEVTCLLQELGFGQIHVAHDGQDALNKLQQLERIDLLLTDLNMPGMDGVELISNLEKNTHYRMFVAVMSGVERDVLDVIHAIADASTLEVIGVLSKPLRQSDLRNMLQHCDPLAHRENKKWMQLTFTAEDVQQALDNRQLIPFLQPKVLMADASLYGFEALVRWIHPEHGVIPHLLRSSSGRGAAGARFLLPVSARHLRGAHHPGRTVRAPHLFHQHAGQPAADGQAGREHDCHRAGPSTALQRHHHRSHRDHLHVQPRHVAGYFGTIETAGIWHRNG